MKISMQEINAITEIFSKIKDKEIQPELAIKLSKLNEELKKGAMEIQKQTMKAIEKYLVLDENKEPVIEYDGNVKVRDDVDAEEANREINESTIKDLPLADYTLSIKDLSELKLTFGDIETLLKIIK